MKRMFLLLFIACLSLDHSLAQSANAEQLMDNFKTGKYEISDYNTACYFALTGNPAAALTYLKAAIDNGFSNPKTLMEDQDLLSLHNDSSWNNLVQRTKTNEEKLVKLKGAFYNQRNFWDPPSLKTPYRSNIPEDEKIAGLSKLWSEAKYNFVNFDLVPFLNFDSLYLAYLPKVRASQSTLEYYKLLIQFYASLKDGHTNVYVPDTLTNEMYARPLIRSRLIEDKVIIVNVFDSALLTKGLKPGLEITTINSLPVKQYASDSIMPYQSSSTPQDMNTRAYEYALFAGSIDNPIKLKLNDGKGSSIDFTIDRVTPQQRSIAIQLAPFEFKMLDGNIAYVALNTFASDDAAKAFDERYDEISKASAIIFDVRNNGGGSTGVGWHILSYLIDKPVIVHRAYSRSYIASYRAWGTTQKPWEASDKLGPNGKFLFKKPVIVLTSSRTFSAAEDFVAAYKSMNRGVIVGEATGGSSGQPLGLNLPSGGTARICTKRDQFGNSEDFIGKGIMPDKVVMQTVADFRKGIDTQLQAAKKLLQQKQ